MEDSSLRIRQKKVLSCILELALQGYESDDRGIYLILIGSETPFAEGKCFGCLRSYKSKLCLCDLRLLFRHGYVSRRYEKENGLYYYGLTPKGELVASSFLEGMAKKEAKERKPIEHYRRKETI